MGVRIIFADDGKVFIEREEMVRDLTAHLSLKVRIRKALGKGRATVREIAEEVGSTGETVRKALQRMEGIGSWPTEGKEYEYGLLAE